MSTQTLTPPLTAADCDAAISRALECMLNASTPAEQREWWLRMQAAIQARNQAHEAASDKERGGSALSA